MRDAFGPGTHLGYCTNVHGGETLERIRADLRRVAVRVRELVTGSAALGIGLWLPARAAQELLQNNAVDEFGRWLDDNGLYVFTLNGFPFGDFHGPIVKRKVYQPDWSDPARGAYTRNLATILDRLAPPGEPASISTLPIAWRGDLDETSENVAVTHLIAMAEELANIERRTGRLIHLDLEPEPGCLLEKAADAARLGGRLPDATRRYLRICHDVCHAAVMFEEQHATLEAYRRAGWSIGKVQASSAPRLALRGNAGHRLPGKPTLRPAEALRPLVEPRYLHQTTLRGTRPDGERIWFFEDLPEALSDQALTRADEARVHFHVPVHLERIGPLATTQGEIRAALAALLATDGAARTPDPDMRLRHIEVETYAGGVLPENIRPAELAEGIAAELNWLREELRRE